ncbi:unnamed protein product [Closterium sp. NIES-54]
MQDIAFLGDRPHPHIVRLMVLQQKEVDAAILGGHSEQPAQVNVHDSQGLLRVITLVRVGMLRKSPAYAGDTHQVGPGRWLDVQAGGDFVLRRARDGVDADVREPRMPPVWCRLRRRCDRPQSHHLGRR